MQCLQPASSPPSGDNHFAVSIPPLQVFPHASCMKSLRSIASTSPIFTAQPRQNSHVYWHIQQLAPQTTFSKPYSRLLKAPDLIHWPPVSLPSNIRSPRYPAGSTYSAQPTYVWARVEGCNVQTEATGGKQECFLVVFLCQSRPSAFYFFTSGPVLA